MSDVVRPVKRSSRGSSGYPMAGDSRYLLILQGETSTRAELGIGEFRIGGPGAELELDGENTPLAILRVTQHRVTFHPLRQDVRLRINSRNVQTKRVLTSGDTVTFADTTIVFQSSTPAIPTHELLDEARFLACLNTELERARRSWRALPVLLAEIGPSPDWQIVPELLRGRFRVSDILGRVHGDRLMVLMPEAGPEIAPVAAERILDTFDARSVRVGLAICPGDGITADALLASARAALDAVAPRCVGLASQTFESMTAGTHQVVVADPAMTRVYELMRRVARSDLSVLITGETGTGKDVAASVIHNFSPRKQQAFVAFSCAAIPDELLESELFGHARGAFTGAVSVKAGRIEMADGGTLFLDEVAELSPAAQAKLLRVLETHSVIRVGDVHPRAVDIRVVAATNLDVDRAVADGSFRRDLYYRLGGATLWLPPLRDRPRDLSILARRFLQAACAKIGRDCMNIGDAAMYLLATHSWPGNVRELRNLMTFVATTASTTTVEPQHIQARLFQGQQLQVGKIHVNTQQVFRPLVDEVRELEIERITAAMAHTGGNQTRAAKLLSVPLRTFVNKLKRYGIARDR